MLANPGAALFKRSFKNIFHQHFTTAPSGGVKSSSTRRSRLPPKALIQLTEAAKNRLKELGKEGSLRISTKSKGCSGLSYSLEYVQSASKGDEVVRIKAEDQDAQNDVTVFIDSKSIMHVIGSLVDYHSTPLSSGFTFSNPNVVDECGCGQSFAVKNNE